MSEKRRVRETDLEVVVVVVLSSSERVQPSFVVAQGTGEEGPCSQNQMGTFLEHRWPTEFFFLKMQFEGHRGLQPVCTIIYTIKKDKEKKQDTDRERGTA